MNNKGADHPAHPQSLISAFVFPYWKASHLDLLQPKFHFFYLVSVNEQAGLNLTLWETQKTGFVVLRPTL